jgi:hydrogenase maturation protease
VSAVARANAGQIAGIFIGGAMRAPPRARTCELAFAARDTCPMPETVLIVGVGNPLARDEGAGIAAVARLREGPLPPGVRVIDAGTDLLAALPEMAKADRALLVDAVRAGGPPGTIYRLTLDELLEKAKAEAAWRSAHDLSVVSAVRLARDAGIALPPTVVLGVEPGEVALGEGLTPAVEAALGPLVEKILAEVNAGG